jgi:uncharacterized LabA/DUF88 family protein
MQSDQPIGNTGAERDTTFSSNADPLSASLPDRTDNSAFIAPRRDRIAILIDGASLFYAALQLQIEIDYLRLLHHLRGNRQLLRAYFYTGSDRANERQQGFLLWMRRNGYRVVTKDLVTLPDGSRKANLDVEIAIDMMTLGNYCDTIVLLSGTGDLSYAVNALSYRGVKIEIISLRANTSDNLINLADRFTDLYEIQTHIRKRNDPPP